MRYKRVTNKKYSSIMFLISRKSKQVTHTHTHTHTHTSNSKEDIGGNGRKELGIVMTDILLFFLN